MNRRLLPLFALLVAAAVGACQENLASGTTCPALCPSQTYSIHDTVIDPVLVFDSTFVGYPSRGQELGLLLATRGDTLEVRSVIRFDSLTTFYVPTGDTAHTITKVDSSTVRLILDTARARLPDSVRFEVYDVDDTTASDTSAAAVLALYRPDRRIGRATFAKATVHDTLFVPLSDSAVLDKIINKKHLRLGLRVGAAASVWLRVNSVETGAGAVVFYKGTPDTAIKAIRVGAYSATPAGTLSPEIRNDLTDFSLVAKNALPPDPNAMRVGGVPGSRAYLRFNLPRAITDSTTVIRATLQLTQRPLALGDARDTMTVHLHVVLAGPQVTDLRRATNIISAAGLLTLDSLLISPRDSGRKTFELFSLVRAWGRQSALLNPPPRAVVLRASPESVLPFEARFFSSASRAGLRPAMRVWYVPRVNFGVP